MATPDEKQRQAILESVRREFPGDEMMQELHYIRRLHQLETEGMSAAEEIAYYEQTKPPRPRVTPPNR